MANKKLKVAMGQILVEFGRPKENLTRAKAMIAEAAGQGCDIVVLPECLDLGWTYPGAAALSQPIPGEYSDELAAAAREAGIYVVAGLTEKAGERLYNAAIMLSPEGDILAKHRKINELDIAHDLYSIGNSLSVTETPFGIVGVNICADNSPNSLALGHAQARMGAQIILSPCAWAVRDNHNNETDPYGAMWRNSYSSLANLYNISVVGVSNVGRVTGGAWNGWKCIGCSLAVDADANVAAQGPYGDTAEALIVAEIEIRERPEKGTLVGGMLAAKGYTGP
jgi:predicted amidohydrolase